MVSKDSAKIIGYMGWALDKVVSKQMEETRMYLVEGTQRKFFSDEKTKWFFNNELENLIHHPQQ